MICVSNGLPIREQILNKLLVKFIHSQESKRHQGLLTYLSNSNYIIFKRVLCLVAPDKVMWKLVIKFIQCKVLYRTWKNKKTQAWPQLEYPLGWQVGARLSDKMFTWFWLCIERIVFEERPSMANCHYLLWYHHYLVNLKESLFGYFDG